MHKVFLAVMFFMTNTYTLLAKDLGIIGATYSIQEKNLLDVLKNELEKKKNSTHLQLLQAHLDEKMMAKMDRPAVVSFLTPTLTARTYNITVDNQNDVQLPYTLLFYNADDEKQKAWAKVTDTQLQGKTKRILVGGSVMDETKRFNTPTYFDQNGVIATKLQLQHVPAIVTLERNQLVVREVSA